MTVPACRLALLAYSSLAFFVFALPATAQMQGGTHAAIAFSRAIYGVSGDTAAPGVGTSWGWFSRADAQRTALRACNLGDPTVTDCRIELSITRGCAALAVGTRGVTAASSTARGASVRAASAEALGACRRNAQNCRVVATTCARSRDRP